MQGSGLSGGVFWHLRCLRSRQRWRPTSRAIADWLGGVRPVSRQLLLIGPSAGWMLPGAWLTRFASIEAFDLDPLAAWLFDRNHGARLRARGTRWRFRQIDALAGLPELLAEFPAASVLFDNLLGQQRFRLPDPLDATPLLVHVRDALQGRDWGSVHDLFSGPVRVPAQTPVAGVLEAWCAGDGVRCPGLDTAASQALLLGSVGATGEWLDHLSGAALPDGLPCRLIHWPFAADYVHWLQAAWVPGAAGAGLRPDAAAPGPLRSAPGDAAGSLARNPRPGP